MTPLHTTRVTPPRRVFVRAPLRLCPITGPCDVISECRVGNVLTLYAVRCVATGMTHHVAPQYVFDPPACADVVFLADERLRRVREAPSC